MSAFRSYRHDFTLFKSQSAGNDARVPADSWTIDAYRRGATSSQSKTISTGGGQTLTVYDIGDIQVGDTVTVGPTSPGTRTISVIGSGILTFAAGGSGTFSPGIGSRIVPTNNRPRTFINANQSSPETSVASQATTSSLGAANFYTYQSIIDCIAADGGGTFVQITDQTGLGISVESPFQWNARGDGVTDDTAALRAIIARAVSDGVQRITIPPGNYLINSTITITNASGLSFVASAPGQVSILFGHPAGAGFDLTGVCSDVSFEDIVFSTSTANTSIIQTGTGTIRFAAKRCSFTVQSNRTGIIEQGIDARIVDCVFTGSTPVTWVRLNGAQRAQLQGCFGIWSGNASGRIIDIDTGCRNIRLLNCDFKGNVTGNSAASGVVGLRNSAAGTAPRDIILTGCHFAAGTTGRGVDIDAAQGFQAIGCTIEDSLVGYSIDAGTSIKIIGGLCVGIQNESVDINGGSHIRIVELESSDVSQAGATTKDHVNIAAGVDDVSIMGMTVGNFIRSSGIQGRNAVRIEAGVSDRIQLLGIRGTLADIVDWVTNLSTSHDLDISHNVQSGLTYEHLGLQQQFTAGSAYGQVTLTGAEASLNVVNIFSVFLNQSGNTNWPDGALTLINAAQGQIVRFINISGAGRTATFNRGATFHLGAATRVLSQHDTLTLMFSSGGNWVETAFVDNT